MKRWSKDQLIEQLDEKDRRIRQVSEELDEKRGDLYRLRQDYEERGSQLRSVSHERELYKRLLTRLVGM